MRAKSALTVVCVAAGCAAGLLLCYLLKRLPGTGCRLGPIDTLCPGILETSLKSSKLKFRGY